MLFSSYTFIFMFLPFVLVIFLLLQRASFKNHLIIAKVFLILSSLFFYAYWKLEYLPILLISIVINYIIARQILISGYNHLSINNTYNINNINTNKIDSINNMDNNINHNNTNNIYGGGGVVTCNDYCIYKNDKNNNTNNTLVSTNNTINNSNIDSINNKTDSINSVDNNIKHNTNILNLNNYLSKNKIDSINTNSYIDKLYNLNKTKLYVIIGIIFNIALLGFFKYTDFLLENFNLFSQIFNLDFNIPLPHILLPLALSFVTFQQIAFLIDCYKEVNRNNIKDTHNINKQDNNADIKSNNIHKNNTNIIHINKKDFSITNEYNINQHRLNIKDNITNNNQSNNTLINRQHNITHINFLDYCLFISFFPQLIAGPIVHHKEMMPQFSKMLDNVDNIGNTHNINNNINNSSLIKNTTDNIYNTNTLNNSIENKHINNSNKAINNIDSINNLNTTNNIENNNAINKISNKKQINWEYLAKGLFIFSIGLFKKSVIADSFAKWANAGFKIVEDGGHLNIFESWVTSLSYTFQLYFDFSGYCDMAIGLGLLFGIILPINFNSPYKALNITDFWRRWHITLSRFLKEYLYIPLGGNKNTKYKQKKHYILLNKILTLRNLFIVALLSGIWHGAGFGFIIWGILHGIAMVIHRIYNWIIDNLKAKDRINAYNINITNNIVYTNIDNNTINNIDFNNVNTNNININHTMTNNINDNININNISNINTESIHNTQYNNKGNINNDSIVNNNNKVISNNIYTNNNINTHANNTKIGNIDDANVNINTNNTKNTHTKIDTNNIKYSNVFLRFINTKTYKILCWILTFNFINISWVFFRSENIQGAFNLLKGMFGIEWVMFAHNARLIPHFLNAIQGRNETLIYIILGFVVCLCFMNSIYFMKLYEKYTYRLSIYAYLLFACSFFASLFLHRQSLFLYFNF